MDIQRFFNHWNLAENPFQAEEARNDAVYERTLSEAVTHPDFQKVFGNPANPSTAIVFGEKGSGKTAMRLMMERKYEEYNEQHAEDKVWVVRYDDLNPILDRLARHMKTEDPETVLASYRLADHQDAILSLATTRLLDTILTNNRSEAIQARRKTLRQMGRQQRIDLATLAILYDQPRQAQTRGRWKRLKKMLKAGTPWNRATHGVTTLLFAALGIIAAGFRQFQEEPAWYWQVAALAGGAGFLFFGGWWVFQAARNGLRAMRVRRDIRTVTHSNAETAEKIWDLPESAVKIQPIPARNDNDSRFELTHRLLRVFEEIGFGSLIVLIDRIDEPVMINSDSERMKLFIWPTLNNKFLQQEQFGVKMLLPIELGQRLAGESSEFKRQARLDKQNLINPLKWTGATLYDLCTARFRSCQKKEGSRIEHLKELFQDDVSDEDLIEALDQMHQPRDAFKFIYAVIQQHCQNTPGDTGEYKIPRSTLEQVRRDQAQRVVDLYRGVATG
jgi:hypothetical protein